jgi:hypothetical protein
MSNEEYKTIRYIYQEKHESLPPPPWKSVPIDIRGVTAIGFGDNSDFLLVLSHSGIGVVDVLTGQTLAREPSFFPSDPYPVAAAGIGPLAGATVRLSGIWGGGMRTMSPDGWMLYKIAPNWPDECVVLCPPDAPELEDEGTATMLVKDANPSIRAYGFSDTGRSLAVSNTELLLWSRP